MLEALDKNLRSPHVYIVGQTASGKTGFALDLCEELELEVLNTDSLLFYKGLDIGTAKPNTEELLRVPHHMVDVCEAGEELTAADYLKKSEQILSDHKRKFLCVGGSGFYVNALDVGLLPLPDTDLKVKEEVLSIENPVEELKKVDPEIFEKISEKDTYRVGRALEVYKQTGKPLSLWQKEFAPKPLAKKIAFDWERPALRKRIEKRTESMLQNGFVEEVEALLQKGLVDWKPLSSVGYLQVVKYLQGAYKSKVEMVDEIVLRTMQLSKRQKTWFKKDKSVTWFSSSDQKKAKEFLNFAFKENQWKV